jgi:polysaccharide export outer membrane protein
MNYKACIGIFAIAVSATLLGCTDKLRSTPNAEGDQGLFHAATGHDTSQTEYVVDPPDEIQIKAPNIKEIDGSKQVVRADGKISLNLLREVKVSGLTPAQIEKNLVEIASKYYTNPDIKIEVIANSKFYTIFGRGSSTGGKKPYTGNDTVIKALAEAGLNENAWPQQVWVTRPARDGSKPAVAVVNFVKIQQTGDLRQNYVLHEGDIITISDSPLSSFNFKVTQVLGPVTGASEAGNSVTAAGRPR